MKNASAVAVALLLLILGCSKNDNPTGPTDSSSGGTTRIYVNPASGSDSNPGTDSAPLKTIQKALSLAQAGQHVELQAGTYDAASGQVYPDTIPNGVVVEAVTAGLAALIGAGQDAFIGTGTDTLRYLSFQGFQSIMQTSSGVHVAYWLTVANSRYLYWLSSNAQAILTGCTVTKSGVASVTDIAQVWVNSSIISGQPPEEEYFILQKAGTVIMNGTTMSDAAATGIDMRDVSVASLTGCTLSNLGLHGAGGSAAVDMSNSSQLTFRSTSVSGSYGPAVLMRDPGTSVVARASYFYGNGSASGYSAFWQYGGGLDVDSCYVSGSQRSGFLLIGGSVSLKNSTVQSMVYCGIEASSGTSVYMRNTAISYCAVGVYLEGPNGSADFGSSTSVGGNTITNNSQLGVRVGYSGGQTVSAVGNTWIANVEGADANGQYGSALVTGPVNAANGSNYEIDYNGGKIQF